MRRFFLYLSYLISHFGQGQTSISNALYYPENDSLIWESPISSRLVTKERIIKVEVSEKKWQCECISCCYSSDPSKVNCAYSKTRRVYMYDSLGFPIKIVVTEDSSSKVLQTFKCTNIYNAKRQLVRSELHELSIIDDIFFLASIITRDYNEENLLQVSKGYFPASKIVRKREYKYNKQGCVEAFFEYRPGGNQMELYRSRAFLYNDNNKVIQSGVGSVHTVFLYDNRGQDSGYYMVVGKDIIRKAQRINIEAHTTGTVVTMHNIRNRFCHKKLELQLVKEIKNDKVYFWQYNYSSKTITESCDVLDLKTDLPLYKVNYGTIEPAKFVRKYVRFKRVKTPAKLCRVEFPPRPNITEYTYTNR